MSKPRLLHLSADYPDPLGPDKTKVFERLNALVSDRFDQQVVSINRRASPFPARGSATDILCRSETFDDGLAVEYRAPSKGFWLCSQLERLGDALLESGLVGPGCDLILAHKLTMEGLMAARLSSRLGIPYAIVIQGNTDTKIAALRPDLRTRYRAILAGAAQIFCLAPWAWRRLKQILGPMDVQPVWLPAPTDLDEPLEPCVGNGEFVSAFHLDSWRTKGLPALVRAASLLGPSASPIAILGGGSEQALRRCRNLASMASTVRLEGAVAHAELPQRMNRASGFVLPSRRESFGLVFIEALFAGLPIIYPRGAAIDGYFDEQPFAVGVDARDPTAIGKAMRFVLTNEHELKEALRNWHRSDDARRFQRASIGRQLAEGLSAAAAAAAV